MDKLEFEADSLANFVARADANFPFTTPLRLQVVSSNNHVITGGPNSELVSTTLLLVAKYHLHKAFNL